MSKNIASFHLVYKFSYIMKGNNLFHEDLKNDMKIFHIGDPESWP